LYGDTKSITSTNEENDVLRHKFNLALGDRHIASDSDIHHFSKRDYLKKIKKIGNVSRKAGGCG